MADTFVITGTRPPSAVGNRPLTASSKDFGYFTKQPQSTVDETLFHSHHTSSLSAPIPFATPWEGNNRKKDGVKSKTKTKPSRPLLWAPPSSSNHFVADDINDNSSRNSNNNCVHSRTRIIDDDNASKSFGTIRGIPMKNQFRPLKHTASFVDETLFGDPLVEPGFKAPWEEKRKVKQTLNWYPDSQDRRPMRRRRPVTALGLHSYSNSSSAVPVWKP